MAANGLCAFYAAKQTILPLLDQKHPIIRHGKTLPVILDTQQHMVFSHPQANINTRGIGVLRHVAQPMLTDPVERQARTLTQPLTVVVQIDNHRQLAVVLLKCFGK